MKRSTILLAALLATTACTQSTSSQPAGSLAGVDQSLIDKSVKPGDDFNAYASGAWAAKTEIPADRSSVGVGFDVFKVAEARNRELIEGNVVWDCGAAHIDYEHGGRNNNRWVGNVLSAGREEPPEAKALRDAIAVRRKKGLNPPDVAP